ncbi:uncharacterized protein SOCE26_077160 [Sorangium cellulosum]|uniref:Uncharacterized protein n=1 Tax=Sorangium cellulosum TaxID=56 RepID=A0A2L0F3X8_SORCE|nr:hypothetical protein [Sorangium cellulosum]AUX46211.1 uncharacterized protein SOCE26_077160 [Sorangium cellulosum]
MPPRIARRPGPALLPLLAVLVSIALARPARAWVEVHVAGDDVRLAIDRAGVARVEHKVTLKVSGGPLRALDIQGVDPDAQLEPGSYAVPLKAAEASSLASATPVAMELLPPDGRPREDGSRPLPSLRARIDGKGLSRGVFVLFFRYRTDLMKRGLIAQDGPSARVSWAGPLWDDGYDAARLIVELPAAPDAPRVDEARVDEARTDEAGEASADGALAPPTTLSTLRRALDRDELELLRPYAPKGDPLRWAIRADARAFQPASAAAPPGADALGRLADAAASSRDRGRTLYLAAGALLFALYSALVALKAREHERLARAAGVAPRPLVPIPLAPRAALAGLALVAGVALQLLLKDGTAGAALVAAATALAAHRTPRTERAGGALRRPGKWLPVAEAEAFREPPRVRGVYLDVSTRAGKALFAALLAALGAGVYAAHGASPYHAHLLALDATALLAIFCTGRLAELPPDPAAGPVAFLRDVARRVRRVHERSAKSAGRGKATADAERRASKAPADAERRASKAPADAERRASKAPATPELRIVGRLRLPEGSPDADELRLGLAPRAALPGFVSIEVGVVYAPGAGGAIALPEILLRVAPGSPCERAVERLARSGRSSRGRRPTERVLAFTPRLPTARMTAAIAAALVRAVSAAPAGETPQKPQRSAAAPRNGKKAVSAAA